jgi:hypothetical protein
MDVLRYVPRTLELVFLEPLPRTWFETGTATGDARLVSGSDGLLLLLLLPGLIAGLWKVASRLEEPGLFLACFFLSLGGVTGFVVANFGILYRLRLQLIFPAVVLALYGWEAVISWNKAGRPVELRATGLRLVNALR